MKSRMEKYHSEKNVIPKREVNNSFLYEEIYDIKKEDENTITLSDNSREIDINKLKEILDNRENYKRKREYKEIIGEKTSKEDLSIDYEEIIEKDYDINELIKKKKDGTEVEDKVRKISSTQYDILKGLSLKEIESEYFDKEKERTTFVKTSSFEEDKTVDLFNNLKGDDSEELTPAIAKKVLETNQPSSNTFEFEKSDFEDLNKKTSKIPFGIKITLTFFGAIILVSIIFYLLSKFMGS